MVHWSCIDALDDFVTVTRMRTCLKCQIECMGEHVLTEKFFVKDLLLKVPTVVFTGPVLTGSAAGTLENIIQIRVTASLALYSSAVELPKFR